MTTLRVRLHNGISARSGYAMPYLTTREGDRVAPIALIRDRAKACESIFHNEFRRRLYPGCATRFKVKHPCLIYQRHALGFCSGPVQRSGKAGVACKVTALRDWRDQDDT